MADDEENVVFCGVCSAKLRDGVRYCWKCQSDQTQVGPPVWSSKPSTSGTAQKQEFNETKKAEKTQLYFGRPRNVPHGKVLSFEQFLRKKTTKENSASFRPKKKAKSDPNEEVMVYVGIKRFKDGCLKTVKGKRLPLRVPKSATCKLLLQKAVEKMSAFDRSFDTNDTYDLLYEDGSIALFMPGTKDFFELEKYRFELGRDYKRITFYLCTRSDIDLNDGILDNEEDTCVQVCKESEGYNMSLGDPETSQEEQVTSQDEELARQLQEDWNNIPELTSTFTLPEIQESDSLTPTTTGTPIKEISDVICVLSSKVDTNDQFFLTTRRKAPLSRILSLWQRQTKKKSPMCRIMVQYSGEAGIDSGAMAKEFLEDTMEDIAATFFEDGVPVNSTFHVQNGNFRTCGEIVASSIAQGGPPPCFLEECAYYSIFTETDLTYIQEKDLGEKEKQTLASVRSDVTEYSDFIIEHGYTGIINQKFVEDIVNSLKVRFVSNRMLYMKEFKKGLDVYGLGDIIAANPDVCQALFVKDFKKDLVPDADYLFSLMEPIYSEEGSTKRIIEESIVDYLQDLLIALEDTSISGHSAAIAWNYIESTGEQSNLEEVFETPDMSVRGVMGWLTGQRHKHVMPKERPAITVKFDHDCLVRNPSHRICFPLVGACGRELTIPAAHMNDAKKFKELFIIAYCMGQSFAKP